MNARGRVRGAALAMCAVLALAGCGRAADREAPLDRDPARERVLAFWTTYNAATQARIARDLSKAAGLYADSLTLDPRHEDSLYYLGQCHRELEQPEEARTAFERLVALNPASARGHLALGALLASPDPDEPFDLAAAEIHLRRAHEINGEETGPMVRLGEVLLVRGQRGEARSWFESALRTNHRSVESALLAGYLDREGAGGHLRPLVERVREAAKAEGPVRGVLGEGDRRAASPPAGEAAPALAAPPLESPLGRLLFEAPVLALRSGAAEGRPIEPDDVLKAWRRVDDSLREYEERARGGARSPSPVPAAAVP